MTTHSSSTGFFGSLARTRTFRVAATLVLLGLAGEAWNLHLNAPPQVTIPPPAPLPNPNAFDELVRLSALKVEPADAVWRSVVNTTSTPSTNTPKTPVRLVTDAERQAALAKAEPVLNAVRTSLATHAYCEPAHRQLGQDNFTHLAGFRSLARTFAFESRMRERAGDYVGAASSALDTVQLGITMMKGGELIAELVGYAIEAIGWRELWGLTERLNAEQSKAATLRLETIEAGRTPFADILTDEKWSSTSQLSALLLHNLIAEAFRQLNGNMSGKPSEDYDSSADDQTPEERDNARRERLRDWCELMTHSKQQIVDDEMRMMDECIAQARQPYTAPQTPVSQPHDPINRYYSMEVGLYRNGMFNEAKARLNDDFLLLAFALNAYRLQNGAYPNRLDALKNSGLLHSIPDDPFAPKTGVPLHYNRTGSGQFLLYSVGSDGIDDGGRAVKSSDSRSRLAPQLEATDRGDWVYGINTPRVKSTDPRDGAASGMNGVNAARANPVP